MTITQHPYNDADLPHLQSTIASWTKGAGRCGYVHPGKIGHPQRSMRTHSPVTGRALSF